MKKCGCLRSEEYRVIHGSSFWHDTRIAWCQSTNDIDLAGGGVMRYDGGGKKQSQQSVVLGHSVKKHKHTHLCAMSRSGSCNWVIVVLVSNEVDSSHAACFALGSNQDDLMSRMTRMISICVTLHRSLRDHLSLCTVASLVPKASQVCQNF